MIKHFVSLQWKSFVRAASFKTNLAFRILMILGALYFAGVFLMLGVGVYFIIEDMEIGDPLQVINGFMFYYFVGDLILRYTLQKMPVMNIRTLLYLPLTKKSVVRYSLWKTIFSFFNIMHAFFFVPFSFVLLSQGYDPIGVVAWHLGMFALFYSNNFINIMMNNLDSVFYPLAAGLIALGASQYYGWFNITSYTQPFFQQLYETPWTAIIPWIVLVVLYIASFAYFRKNMYLDAGLATKRVEAKTEEYTWLNRFGNLGPFLKNDIRLIRRNKRSRTAVIMGVFFLFYGLFFFTGGEEMLQHPTWKIFAGIFISGGFLFSFGQYVPSWDSAYYPLMMSQNIQYKEYLNSKWYLVIFATIISTILAAWYLFFGVDYYIAILVGALYNVGINSYLVLWGGAYIKTPIDLSTNKNAFGDKQAFNAKTMLLTIPKLLLPLVIYMIGYFLVNSTTGYILVGLSGILGFVFKNRVFRLIEQIYKKEKYKTLLAYSQKGA